MYVSKSDLKAVIEALGMVEHEAASRGDEEMEALADRLEKVMRKMGNDIKRRSHDRRDKSRQ